MKRRPMIVCDSQVHAPDLPSRVPVRGIDERHLLRAMRTAGVDRCVIVPLPGIHKTSSSNGPALEMARRHPDRFAVMGRLDLTDRDNVQLLACWRDTPGMLGVRLSFAREPERGLFVSHAVEWCWDALEAARVPVMVFVPDLVRQLAEIAGRHPTLPIVVDHLGLRSFATYTELMPVIEPLLGLARYPNVAVKASALPAAVAEPFPFRSVWEPLRQVVEAFGPKRVFWGSDLTRLPCTYTECVAFVNELPWMDEQTRAWFMGRGLLEWLDWN